MAWNEPEGPGDKDPWGRKRDSAPPDLEQILRNIRNRLSGLFGRRRGGGRRGGGGLGLGLIIGVAVLIWLFSGCYTVQQGESGVVLRFGKKTEVVAPGLHWHLPFPIERKEVVSVEKVQSLELGYRRNEKTLGVNKVPKEALMLTGDGNIVDAEFAIQYKIKNASDYLFNISQPELTIAQAAESAAREVIARNSLDVVMTTGRAQVQQDVQALLQQTLDRYQSGIQVTAIEMQPASAPEEVKGAFEDAIKATEDAQRLKNDAQAYANDIIPKARGAATRLIEEAQAYKASTIARAEGDARRFSEIAAEYVKAPAVTRERLYIEAIEQILSSTTKIFVDQKGGNSTLNLPLDKLIPPRTAPAATAKPATEAPVATAPAPQEPIRERGRDSRRRGVPQ